MNSPDAAERPDEATTLFVYGSLRDPVRRHDIIGRRVDTLPATLDSYEPGHARFFYIRKRPGTSTAGLLLLNLTPQDFEKLDHYEEVPRLYTREKIDVFVRGGHRVRCWVYLPTILTLAGEK